MSDYDKQKWQAEQEANDTAQSAYRDKMARARERSAANAKRKIARLHAKLTELGHISDFEDEFGESVLERLETFGSAFYDLEKGRPGDALSMAQKQVVSRMNKKVKELKRKQAEGELDGEPDPDSEYTRTADRWKTDSKDRPRSSFQSKRKPKFTPRVRQIEEEFDDAPPVTAHPPRLSVVKPAAPAEPKVEKPKKPSIVEIAMRNRTPNITPEEPHTDPALLAEKSAPYIPEYTPRPNPTGKKRPFLRIVE